MQRSLPGAVWALLLVNFVGSLGFTITLPLMPYYAATFGADPFTVGLIASSYAVCALIAGPILGQLSDRQGRRPCLLFSQLGTVIGFVVTALGGSGHPRRHRLDPYGLPRRHRAGGGHVAAAPRRDEPDLAGGRP